MPFLLALFFFTSLFGETIEEIDREMAGLQEQLNVLRKEELNIEIEGQSYFLDEWSDYVKMIEKAGEKEKKADAIAARLAELQAKKQALLKQKP